MTYDILAAIVAYLVIGLLWYGPIFGKKWKKLTKIKKCDNYGKAMLTMIIIATVASYMISLFIGSTTVFADGALVGLKLSVFPILVFLGQKNWEKYDSNLAAINAGFYIVSYAVMGGLLAYV